MYDVEVFPLGVESSIVLKLENELLSWSNVTASVNFTHILSTDQDTYQSKKNSTYYQRINDNWQAGRDIENDAFGEFTVDHLIWHSVNRTFILNDDLNAESPLNITLSAPNIISTNVTTHNIASLSLTTQDIIVDHYDRASYTEYYQGLVVTHDLGNSSTPIYELNIAATNVILLGENQIYKAKIAAFNNSDNSAAFANQSLCSIDTSHLIKYVGYELSFKSYGDQCILLAGKFLIENILILTLHEVQQRGSIVSNGDILVDAYKVNITDEIIVNNAMSFRGSGEVVFDINSTIRSNSKIEVTDYQSTIFKGIVEAVNKINITSDLFLQEDKSNITTNYFVSRGDHLKLCGAVNIQKLESDAKLIEFCPTARGKIKFAFLNTLEFKQNSNITISHLSISNATRTSFLTETSYDLQLYGTVLESLILETEQLDYQGMIYAIDNFTADLIGDHLLHDEIRTAKIYLNVTGNLANNATFTTYNSTIIANSFTNEGAGKVTINNTGSFLLKDAMYLNPHSEMKLGAIEVMSPEGAEINTLFCKGGQLVVRGVAESTILTDNLINQIEFYKKEKTTSSNKKSYTVSRCYTESTGWWHGGDGYRWRACSGDAYYLEEHHSYGEKGVIVVNGKLDLGVTYVTFELSNNFFKELNLIKAPIAPTIISKHINKIVYVSKDVIGVGESPYSCTSIASDYGIDGATCVGTKSSGYTLTKAIDEVSATFIAENITGTIEDGILINWQKLARGEEIAKFTGELVVFEDPKKLEAAYYTSPDIRVDKYDITRQFSENMFKANFEKLFATPPKAAPLLLSDGKELELYVRPILVSSGFTMQCADKVGQDQFDCEQYIFLKELGFKGNIDTQFDFTMWVCRKILKFTMIYVIRLRSINLISSGNERSIPDRNGKFRRTSLRD